MQARARSVTRGGTVNDDEIPALPDVSDDLTERRLGVADDREEKLSFSTSVGPVERRALRVGVDQENFMPVLGECRCKVD